MQLYPFTPRDQHSTIIWLYAAICVLLVIFNELMK